MVINQLQIVLGVEFLHHPLLSCRYGVDCGGSVDSPVSTKTAIKGELVNESV